MAKTIITAALTGAVTPKDKCPALPITPKEIAEDGVRCWKAGAAILHLHMRDDEGRGTMDPAKFRETVHILRNECDAILNLTTSGELGVSDERRMEHLIELKPEMGTYDAGSINTHDGVFENSLFFLEKLGNCMIENGVKPEVEVMDFGMINTAKWFLEKGSLLAPIHWNFVLSYGVSGCPATPKNLCHMLDDIPEGSTWSAFGVGSRHLPILYTALALGGHLRVGLEDCIWYAKDVPATNLMLVERAARVVREYGNEVATTAEARKILGLNK
ncbi:MAG: 3-keto-5-aminohexanoate cleavage protein [Lachnospiraceae bacterium]|jgi:3-keto-5-aminohexanoate cleavage enzyme